MKTDVVHLGIMSNISKTCAEINFGQKVFSCTRFN